MEKIKSIIKKAVNLNLSAYEEGEYNYRNGLMEEEALQRAQICKGCDKAELEPIEELRVQDTIQEISGKMCGACGCTLSYLLRQNQKHCKLKKW